MSGCEAVTFSPIALHISGGREQVAAPPDLDAGVLIVFASSCALQDPSDGLSLSDGLEDRDRRRFAGRLVRGRNGLRGSSSPATAGAEQFSVGESIAIVAFRFRMLSDCREGVWNPERRD
jgi:hypothetical protein